MSHPLIDRSEDLTRLKKEGYNISIEGANLVVRDVPYVGSDGGVHYDGILAAPLTTAGDKAVPEGDHTIRFAGQGLCKANGQPYASIRPNVARLRITENLETQYHLSAKPPSGNYSDFHHKIQTYVGLITGQASVLDKYATARTKAVREPEEDEDYPFQYLDTASARAEINMISAKLSEEKVAIIGVGRTGSYILDLVAKTPVAEIHIYDDDDFYTHNAFRSPGAASLEELREVPSKVSFLEGIYSRMHRHITAHEVKITGENITLIENATFAFVCIDAGPIKAAVIEKLERMGIEFVDCGIGVYEKNEKLAGQVRATLSTLDKRNEAREKISFYDGDGPNEYDRNIQIAELNSLNAVFSVIKWKKVRGFYADLKNKPFTTFTVATNNVINEPDDENE